MPAHGPGRHGLEHRQGPGALLVCDTGGQGVARVPVWAKLTPATSDIAEEAGAVFRGGGDAITSSNTFPSLPLVDPETLEFEMHVDGSCRAAASADPPSSAVAREDVAADAGVSGQVVLGHRRHLRVRARAQLLPARMRHRPGVTAAMLDHAIGPSVIGRLPGRLPRVPRTHADRGWTCLDDFRGLLRDRVVAHSRIRRPDPSGTRAATTCRKATLRPTRQRSSATRRLKPDGETAEDDVHDLVKNGTIVTAATATTATSTSTRA